MSDKMFYLMDSRSTLGTNVMFWSVKGGYTSNTIDAEVFDLDRAQRQHNCRETDVPILKAAVDELATTAIDHQYLPAAALTGDDHEYVVQKKGYWNGNDILFVAESGTTYNYDDAKVFSPNSFRDARFDNDEYLVFPKEELDKIVRRVFDAALINKRTMITKHGIRLAKKKRVRPTTGKHRGYCPKCGKITWDFDPHEYAYCKDHQSIGVQHLDLDYFDDYNSK